MITNQKELRKRFWQDNPEADRKKIKDYSGKGKMYKTDTRVMFANWLDYMVRDGQVSKKLAQTASL